MSDGAVIRARVLLALSVVCNFIAPWILYRLSRPGLGETHALMISAVAPMAWSLIQFARNRKIDVLSVMVLGGIALSFAALAFGGSPKLLLFRESLVNGVFGVVLIGSAIVRRPLFYLLVRAVVGTQPVEVGVLPIEVWSRAHAQLERYAGTPGFRRAMTVVSVISGLVFITETAIRSVLVFSLPTERVLLLGPIVGYLTVGLLLLANLPYLYATRSSWDRGSEQAESNAADVSAAP